MASLNKGQWLHFVSPPCLFVCLFVWPASGETVQLLSRMSLHDHCLFYGQTSLNPHLHLFSIFFFSLFLLILQNVINRYSHASHRCWLFISLFLLFCGWEQTYALLHRWERDTDLTWIFFFLIWLWSTWAFRLKLNWWKIGINQPYLWRGCKTWHGCQEGGIWWLTPFL